MGKCKKILIGYVWLNRDKEIVLRWSKPHFSSYTPKIIMSNVLFDKADKKYTWLKTKKVRVTIEEI